MRKGRRNQSQHVGPRFDPKKFKYESYVHMYSTTLVVQLMFDLSAHRLSNYYAFQTLAMLNVAYHTPTNSYRFLVISDYEVNIIVVTIVSGENGVKENGSMVPPLLHKQQ
nr:hypothetical protein Iba_chr04cCG6790 [Ipomoea batatas]GMC90015.1 hypothetical protein Iba_chr04fCG4140 [Ipomoea batatas]